ncbi:MAG: lipid-A-disaccharide synthase N-terminal domain-containing protein [Bacteroidia bacterium]|nr:lipid-A-disaccharide synthase N-terminal domain-containing protein [Bacteroidia bacterium]NNM22516.1 lauroyl acyltransferase [Flavobacteriaceae bacterium]
MSLDFTYIDLIGFAGQGLFFSRFLVQLLLSEKHKRVVTPSLFWKLSLLASVIFFVYGYLREDFSIMLGQSLTYFIYIRNLQLQKVWEKMFIGFRWFLLLFPVLIVIYAYNNNVMDLDKLLRNENIPGWLLALGIVAQLVFIFRFVYQWMISERIKKSHLPLGFWAISLTGSILILSYAIIRVDKVLFLAHSIGMFVYMRNIYLLRKQKDEVA